MTKLEVGNYGEHHFELALRALGLVVRKSTYHHGDRLVNNKIKVEIKTSHLNKQGRYNICLKKKDKYGQTNCQNTDYVVIILVDHNCLVTSVLVIPTSAVSNQKFMSIGKNSSKWDVYRSKNFAQQIAKIAS